MNGLLSRLIQEFSDKEYAHAYMQGHAVSRIAAQIHALRKQRNWTQKDLSRATGIAQERISKIESGDFESLTMKTLQKFAEGFDVDLRITFESFSEGLLDIANLAPDALTVESREGDLKEFSKRKIVSHCGEWKTLESAPAPRLVTSRPSIEPKVGSWQDLPEATPHCVAA